MITPQKPYDYDDYNPEADGGLSFPFPENFSLNSFQVLLFFSD
jgi:hypothetical protein